MSTWLRPLSTFFGAVTGVRNSLYDRQYLRSTKVSRPVVSVGNITTGGTGKTPMIDFLIQRCHSLNLRCGIISRGYGGQFEGIVRVDSKSKVNFGDEPMMLARRYPELSIFVGADRVAVADSLLKYDAVDIILADDAFQHRRIHRDLDIVLMDATQDLRNYKMLPEGRAREGVRSALRRANLIVLTKVNLANKEALLQAREWLRHEVKAADCRALIFEARIEFVELRPLSVHQKVVQPKKGDSVYLVSGIARPSGFTKLVNESLGLHIAEHKVFKDHYEFSEGDLDRLGTQLTDDLPILVTEKDAVKLLKISHKLIERMWSVDTRLNLAGEEERLDEALLRITR